MKTLAAIFVTLAVLAAGAYFVFSDRDYVFKFSETDLRENLDNRLPLTETYFFIFDMTLDNPRIDLVEGSDRVAGGIDVVLNIKLGASEVPLGGAIDVSGGVRYAQDETAFFLTDPVIEAVRIDGVPERYANKANQAISMALGEFYRTRPIYTLSGADVSKVAARLLLKDVVVHDERLVVTLGLKNNSKGSSN